MNNEEYDVVIVGAGIGGAALAKTIAESGGKRILILEAGRSTGMSADKYQSHVNAFYESEAKVPNSPYAPNPSAPQADVLQVNKITNGVPDTSGYLVQNGPLPFSSDYTRALGGTTLHWLGTCLRMLPNDFHMKEIYGHGANWPISYEDLKPYYERAEYDIIGVAANVEDQRYPGIEMDTFWGDYEFPMERIPLSHSDQVLGKNLDGFEVELEDGSHALQIVSSPAGRNSTPRGKSTSRGAAKYEGAYRPVGAVGNSAQGQRCEGNSSCIPICPVQAKYNALKTLSALLREHPANEEPTQTRSSVTVVSQAVVTKLELGEFKNDGTRDVTKVHYQSYDDELQDPRYVKECTVTAKIYVLAAHSIENAKILLASGPIDDNTGLPSGAANRSGQVGRNLMDHPLILTWGLMGEKLWPYRGPGSSSGIPTFRDGEFRKSHSAFIVEVGNWGWSFAANAPYSTFQILSDKKKYFGKELRSKMSEILPRQFRMAWEMEQIPEESNRITINNDYRDRLGNFRPVIDYDLPPYVRAGMKAAKRVSDQASARMGLSPLTPEQQVPDLNDPAVDWKPFNFLFPADYTQYKPEMSGYLEYEGEGFAFEGAGHLVGTHRMGFNEDDSVVDKNQRTWDHHNLYLVGCGNMATIGTSNPTLTMTALAIWAGDNIIKQLES